MIKAAFAGTRGAVSERDKQESTFADILQALGIGPM